MGVEAFTIPIGTINLSIHGSNKKNFNKLYMKAVGPLGLNQAYMLLNYVTLIICIVVVLICSNGSVTGNILKLAVNKKFEFIF